MNHPQLPSMQDVITFVKTHNENGVSKKDLTSHFRIKGQEARREFKELMKSLTTDGTLMIHAKRYHIPPENVEVNPLDAVELNVIAQTDDGELVCEPVNKNLSDDFPFIILDENSSAGIGDTIIANLQPLNLDEGEFIATHVKKKPEEKVSEMVGLFKVRPHGPSLFIPLAKNLDTHSNSTKRFKDKRWCRCTCKHSFRKIRRAD